MIEIVPAVVPASLDDVEKAIAAYAPFARTLHVDFADGVFAPNITWMPEPGARITGMTWEAHLMLAAPRGIGLACIAAGASRVIGHIEATKDESAGVLRAWKQAGATEVGLGVLFHTPLEALEAYIPLCDVVQMMSIASIGVQGIPYEPSAPARVGQLHARYPDLLIADDGGVSEQNIAELARAGVSRFCVGSALSKSPDPASTYATLASLAGGVQ